MNEDVQIVVLVVFCFSLLISAHHWHNTQHNMEMYSTRSGCSPDSPAILCIRVIRFLNGFLPFRSFKIYADRVLSLNASIALRLTQFGEQQMISNKAQCTALHLQLALFPLKHAFSTANHSDKAQRLSYWNGSANSHWKCRQIRMSQKNGISTMKSKQFTGLCTSFPGYFQELRNCTRNYLFGLILMRTLYAINNVCDDSSIVINSIYQLNLKIVCS